MESTSKVFSPSYLCLVQATTFSHLDYSISLQTGLVAFILIPLVLFLNTTANMICLKWKLHHGTLLHWTHRKIHSPNEDGLWASPSTSTQPWPHLSVHLSYSSSCLLGPGQQCTFPLQASAFVSPSAWNALPPATVGLAPPFLAGSTPMSPSQRSLPWASSILCPNSVYIFHTVKGLFFQAEIEHSKKV